MTSMQRKPAKILLPVLWGAVLFGWALAASATPPPALTLGGQNAKSDLVLILTPIFSLVIIVFGVMAWIGKLSWWYFAGAIFGAVLVFGSDQITSWIRTLWGV